MLKTCSAAAELISALSAIIFAPFCSRARAIRSPSIGSRHGDVWIGLAAIDRPSDRRAPRRRGVPGGLVSGSSRGCASRPVRVGRAGRHHVGHGGRRLRRPRNRHWHCHWVSSPIQAVSRLRSKSRPHYSSRPRPTPPLAAECRPRRFALHGGARSGCCTVVLKAVKGKLGLWLQDSKSWPRFYNHVHLFSNQGSSSLRSRLEMCTRP